MHFSVTMMNCIKVLQQLFLSTENNGRNLLALRTSVNEAPATSVVEAAFQDQSEAAIKATDDATDQSTNENIQEQQDEPTAQIPEVSKERSLEPSAALNMSIGELLEPRSEPTALKPSGGLALDADVFSLNAADNGDNSEGRLNSTT